MKSAIEWKSAVSPALPEMEALAAIAWERIEPEFRDVCKDLVIRVEELAPDEVLDELDVESPFDLTALYLGPAEDQVNAPRDPDIITLYRRAILDYWADSEDMLGDIVAHVIIQELGNHFGYSDTELDEIEEEVTARKDTPA